MLRKVFNLDFVTHRQYTTILLWHTRLSPNNRSNDFRNLFQMLRFLTVLEETRQNPPTEKLKEAHSDLARLKERSSDKSQKKLLLDKVPFKNDPDKFGTVSSESLLRNRLESLLEEEDQEVVDFIDGREGKTGLRTIEYSKIVKNFIKERKLKEALDVLEIRMKTERVKPDEYIFRLLISGCAKVGYTKKAFQLFNQMKKCGLNVRGSVYTSLFEACANSPWPADGIKRANALRDLMVEKRVDFNQKIAHAAIKAFGRCGDIERAFTIVDEMSSHSVPITSETINFLLQACASEKEAGFRHALVVWRKMLDRKIIPTTFTYNLLLRCTRDCSVGDITRFEKDISFLVPASHPEPLQLMDPCENKTESPDELCIVESESRRSFMEEENKNSLTANLHHPRRNSVINIGKSIKPWHRLMILGGREGFINIMLKTGAKPDIKTFTQLLFLVSPNTEEEKLLISDMKRLGIKMDLDFCNMLIKKRNMYSNIKAAKEVLSIIKEEQLTPNIVTFGVLAMSCTNLKDIKTLIRDVHAVGFRLNIEILGTLLHSSCSSWDFKAIHYLLQLLIKFKMKPNLKFIEHLQKIDDDILKHIEKKKRGFSHCDKLESSNFEEEYENLKRLIIHVKSLEVEDPIQIHPWFQFRRHNKFFEKEINK